MNSFNQQRNLLNRAVSYVFVCGVLAVGAWAQDTSTTTVQHGPSSFDTQVRNAQVVYVEGNDLVLKLENGRVEHLVVPDSDKFHVDGQEVTVHDLKPGTKLTETITTTISPRYVNTVRTIEGKVWHVNAPKTVILTLGDGANKQYTVPDHAKFTVNGQAGKTVFDLKKGMQVQATVVTDSTHDVIEQSKAVVGQAPPSPETPQQVGTLLIVRPQAVEPITAASAEHLPQELPSTGSALPLIGLLGTLAIAASFGLGAIRRLAV
jgi:hypothetical protein